MGLQSSSSRGGIPRHLEAQIESIGGDRIHLVGPARHLAPNAARVIGLREVTTRSWRWSTTT